MLTPNGVVIFLANDPTEQLEWNQALQETIEQHREELRQLQPESPRTPQSSEKGGVRRQGFLKKRGELNRGWKKRYCRVGGGTFSYSKSAQDSAPLGVVKLAGCQLEMGEGKEKGMFPFILRTPARSYILAADSQQEFKEWLSAISAESQTG
jgi:hypothetical protein